ncbi:MAG: hypothetical protein JHC26_09050 [Thermofilum sp.]|jgi:hypothetical protein|uniref:hypothetical protein n=1 Tax=Thermofilum sp. TaxID=1961369 RepID=UPI002586E5A1|nr:hypothetical protein [Thermofilum sp.]MCI4409226.1 hypothetical protein [Thermofilum sp.]
MAEVGTLLTALAFVKLTLIDALEVRRLTQEYTPRIQKASVNPDKFARIITLNDMTYNGTFWKLSITVTAKPLNDMASDSFNFLSGLVSIINNLTGGNFLNAKSGSIEVVVTSTGSDMSIGTVNAGETKTFDVALYDIYPILDFDLRPVITFHDSSKNVDFQWTGSYKCSLQIPTDNYTESKKAYLTGVLNDMLGQLADIESKMNEDWDKITKGLSDWLGDTLPDKVILASLNPALEDYKTLVATAQELSEKIVQFARANDLQLPEGAYKEILKPPEQLPQLPKRDKLQTRLQQLSADIVKYSNILANDIDQVNQEVIIMKSELDQLKNATIEKLSQLGTAYAKATTQADKQNILNQKDSIINDYFSKKSEITARHRQKIAELLNKCYTDKDMLDKTVATFNYLSGNSIMGGNTNE